ARRESVRARRLQRLPRLRLVGRLCERRRASLSVGMPHGRAEPPRARARVHDLRPRRVHPRRDEGPDSAALISLLARSTRAVLRASLGGHADLLAVAAFAAESALATYA